MNQIRYTLTCVCIDLLIFEHKCLRIRATKVKEDIHGRAN